MSTSSLGHTGQAGIFAKREGERESVLRVQITSKMVLAELGTKLQTALSKLNRTTVVDDEVFNTILKEICGALLESDVQVKLVRELRDGVKLAVSLQDDNTSGLNRRRLIQKSIVDQLIRMLEPEAKPYKLKKGTSNVVMFVGLQVRTVKLLSD